MMKTAMFLICVLAVVSCQQQPQRPEASAPPAFSAWADSFADEWVSASPQLGTRTQWFSGGERQEALDRQLTLVGEWDYAYGQALKAQGDRARKGLESLGAIDTRSLTPAEETSAAIIRWSLEDMAALAAFPRHRYVFDQFNGLHLEYVNFLTQTHPIRNAQDVANHQARLEQVAARLDEGIAEARAAAQEGIVPPQIVLQRSIEQIDGLLQKGRNESVFATTLSERMAKATPALPEADRQAALAAAQRTLADAVLPAYRRVRALLLEQQKTASTNVGVWRLPRGSEYYATQLASYTNTRMTADEIHQLGLREVARIEGEMDALLEQLGYANGSVNERYSRLEAALQPKGSGDPRPQILADYEKAVRDAERRAVSVFDRVPKAPIEVRREPAFSEKTAAAHYTLPAPDGSRPGIFWLPLPGPTFQVVRARSLSHHEAVPGHHFQLALAQEMTDLPKYRRLGIFGQTSAFNEGWALYAERLADENGWFEGDVRGRLGYLYSMLWRARRLVVDTGLHAKQWTREQAIDYGIVPQEVERYIAWPGQACSYMVGQLRIVELREQARAALGDKFNIRQFHNVVLGSGSVPLEVLARNVEAWAAGARQ